MAKSQKIPKIQPSPGYVLCTPYEIPNRIFKPKEVDGLDQMSQIVAIGKNIVDGQGIVREYEGVEGDIIIHAYNNAEFEIENQKYRVVHFTGIHARWESAPTT